jgi:carboxyl-terminal processing protease
MSANHHTTLAAYLACAIVIGALPLAATAQDPHAQADTDIREAIPLQELQTFADVFKQIRAGYVEDIPDSKLFDYAVRGMLEGLDPHSVYLTKEDYSDLQTTTDGEFSGLGIEIGRKGNYIEIISPIDGSPAAKAGLQAGDVILKLDNESVKGLSIDEAVEIMRGAIGSPIVLEIGRAGESKPFDVTVVRDTIQVASVRSRMITPGYGYLRIAQFQRNTGVEVAAAVTKLTTEGALKGLVMDLRNNPGGVLGASVGVSEVFLDGGLVVYTEGRHPSAKEQYRAKEGDMLDGAPIVVLINGGSASASEIVAGALQDRGRAVVMGTRSFGKGSVQTVLPVSETRAVKLTTALYFTPNGRSIQAEGIVPDIVVERGTLTSLEGKRTKEADLRGRLDGAEAATAQDFSAESDTLATLREEDNQLYEAITLLRGVNLLNPRNSAPTRQQDSTVNDDAPTPDVGTHDQKTQGHEQQGDDSETQR